MDIRHFFRHTVIPITYRGKIQQGVYCVDMCFESLDSSDLDDSDSHDSSLESLSKKEKAKRKKQRMGRLEKAYWEKHSTHFLETTRFDCASMAVNKQARGEGCLYGNPRPLKKRQQPFRLVLELNNETNRIDGVGIISDKCLLRGKNAVFRDVYENRLFNQNVYRSAYRLDRSVLDEYSEVSAELFQRLDEGCFHGFYHVKRGNSISKLPFVHIWMMEKEFGVDLVDFIREIFKGVKTERGKEKHI